MRYAVIRNSDRRVENVIQWDGKMVFQPGPGLAMVRIPDDSPVSQGDRYDTRSGEFLTALHPDTAVLGVSTIAIVNTGRTALIGNQEFLDKVENQTLTDPELLAQVVALTVDQMKLIRFFLSLRLFGGDGITDDGKPA